MDAQTPGRRSDTASDFTAIRNEDFLKHTPPPSRCNRLRALRAPRHLASLLRGFAAGHHGSQSGSS
jgi:hypothetical protein